MTSSRAPNLADLVLLWLHDMIGDGHRIEYGGGKRLRSYLDISDYKLMIDGVFVGWLHDTYFEIYCPAPSSDVNKLLPEDPEFFPKLWKHLEQLSEGFDPLYQEKLTTYLKKKR